MPVAIDHRRLAAAGLALAFLLFVTLNAFGALRLGGVKLDATADGHYTLSEQTRDLLAGIEEPIVLRLYVSRGVREANPVLGTYANRVREMLKAYVAASRGKITLELIDPEPFSAEEDRAVGFGLQPLALANNATGYLGLAGTNSTDDADVLPVLSPDRERFLEHDLTRLVYNLAYPDKPVVAVISGLPINADPLQQYRPWQIYEQLRQLFDLRYQSGEITSFEPDVKLLLLVHPQNLSAKTLYAVDQFVLRGGKALVLVDPHSEAAASRQRTPMPGPAASNLPALFAAWGVELVPDRIVGDARAARQVQYPVAGRQQIVGYLAWLTLEGDALTVDDLVTSQLSRINVATAGILRSRPNATTEVKPLLRSSPDSQAIPVDKVAMFPDPVALIRGFEPAGERLTIAARITGPARSAFEGELPEGVEAGADRRTQSDGPISVVVVADTDLLEDRSWLASQGGLGGAAAVIPIADNANLLLNALDFLAGAEALGNLRGRDVSLRPFTYVAELRRNAEIAYRAKEQALVERLQDLQRKLAGLEVGRGDDGQLLSARQKDEIEGFRTQLLETRRELRDVQYVLRRDIEHLRDRLRFANIVAVPLVVALIGIGVALVRRARFRRRFEPQAV